MISTLDYFYKATYYFAKAAIQGASSLADSTANATKNTFVGFIYGHEEQSVGCRHKSYPGAIR